MKRFIFTAYLFVTFTLFAATGSLSGEKNLRVLKTYWFDIIYPQRCEKSAAILYENADFIYEEVTEQYGLTPKERFPIVITPAVESLNAFWSIMPYGHIVIYDTSYEAFGDLSVFSETFLSIFRHELTHAVTFTMKNGFLTGVTKVFGDAMNLGPLLVSSGMAEGATLTSESASGEGRLNDEFSKHYVKQAKIEGRFPSYYGVQGAGNLNPYYFNGAFHEWLQKEYGMEAYSKFWYDTINVKGLTLRGRFKKAFGEKLDTAWKRFVKDYQVPAVHSNPVSNQQVKDFFDPSATNFSLLNNSGSAFASLSSSNKKIYWLDNSCRGIYSAEKDELQHEKPNYKKIFTQSGTYKISPSVDDKYLAVSYYSDDSQTISAKVKIYDLETKQFFTLKENGLKSAAIVKAENEYYLIASKFITPNNSIQIFAIQTNEKGRIQAVTKKSEIELPINVFTSEYISFENNFAYIKKDKLEYSICISDLEGNVIQEYGNFENRMVIHSLSAEKSNLYFSWTQPNTMPRWGYLNPADGVIGLSSEDVSGGIFSPICVEDQIIYIGKFLYQNRIFVYDNNEDITVSSITPKSSVDNEINSEIYDYEIPQSQKFNYFSYLTRGFLVPFSFYTTEYFGSNYGGAVDVDIPLGISFYTGMPWSDGTSDSIIFTGGWNLFSQTAGLELIANFGTDTSLLGSTTDVKTEFDAKGWKLSSLDLTLNSSFHFGQTSIFQMKNIMEAKIGRQYKSLKIKTDDTIYYDLFENLILAYSNVHYTGPGTYQRGGFTISVGAFYLQDSAIDNSSKLLKVSDLYGEIRGYLPQLLPFNSIYGYTYNLPTILSLKILNSNAKSYSIYNLSSSTVLFGMLLKQPMPVIDAIYLQNFSITGGYDCDFRPISKNIRSGSQIIHLPDYTVQLFNGDFVFTDSIFLQADLQISPNVGVFARNDFQFDFLFRLDYKINHAAKETPWNFNFTVNYSF